MNETNIRILCVITGIWIGIFICAAYTNPWIKELQESSIFWRKRSRLWTNRALDVQQRLIDNIKKHTKDLQQLIELQDIIKNFKNDCIEHLIVLLRNKGVMISL